MKVTYRQSGGFAGLTFFCALDTEVLQDEETRNLVSLVEQVQLESICRLDPAACYAIQYEISVESDGQAIHTRYDDSELPPSLLPLVWYLRERAKPCAS